jgi:outer membrane receptor for ferrienterochelin and colicins
MQLYGCANAGGIFFGILCCVGEVLECCFPYKSLHIQPSKSHSPANQGSDNYLCTAMIRYVLLVVFSFLVSRAVAQNELRIVVRDAESNEPLPGANVLVVGTSIGSSTGEDGIAILHIPDGAAEIEISFLGYRSQRKRLTFPNTLPQPLEILLHSDHEELEEVVISSTRSSRTIADIPTRVEFIAGEELDEKANMKPGDIRMLLNESTGIQTQQTSATSANSSIRIQGLDGRYTQILKDGFPLYAGFSGGLGLLQTPPLDLKQVEVIKGSASTLYGGGAIAGLVNLISRTPGDERELRFLANATSAKGLDLSAFYSERYGKAGVTVFASRNSGEPYDPADIDLTAIPEFERYTVNPKFFYWFNDRTSLYAGVNFTTEDRIGGDLHYIEGNADDVHRYFESNESHRYSTQVSVTHKFNGITSLNFKNSINHFDRVITTPGYRFDGTQNSSFSELNIVHTGDRIEWIAGFNLWTDDFSENPFGTTPLRDYDQTIIGAFVQSTFSLSDAWILEAGLRGDHVVDYGFAFLPRVSLLYRAGPAFSSRIGGGFGYKAPTFFTEESERLQYENVLPISPDSHELERSYGANWDLNYRTELGEVALSINHLFFYTYLDDPLVLTESGESHEFVNIDGFIDSRGTETNVKLEHGDFKLFVGYTYTDTRIHDGVSTFQNPLTARHRINNVLMYEVEERWKVGLEAYYFGRQRLTDEMYGKDYWICGFMLERMWEKFSLFINFENFLDARQTRFDTIYTGTVTNPEFRDIYAPVDGFVINGGLKVNL